MGLDFNPSTNPWDVGGKHHQQLPWVQDAKRYGFDYGNDFYTPKSRKQIRDEGLLQMAILAVALAAPALLGAVGGGAAAGAATSGQAAGAALGQGSLVTAGVTGTGSTAIASIATAAFLQSGALERISAQARKGESTLNHYFHEVAPINDLSTQNQFEWQPDPIHPSMKLLKNLITDPKSIQALQEGSRFSKAIVPKVWVQQVASSLEQISRDPIPPELMAPIVLYAPASAIGGPPEYIIDKNGKITPLMRTFMEIAFDFSPESIDETIHKTIESGWFPEGREVIAKQAFQTGANAITLGEQVTYRKEYWYGNTSVNEWIAIAVHEHTHRQEIWESNDLGWYSAYLLESLYTPYRDLSFEKRAYDNQAEADRFLLSEEGIEFKIVIRNTDISDTDKGFWIAYYALKGVKEPHLKKIIKNLKKEIFQTELQIQTLSNEGEAVPEILSSKLKGINRYLEKSQLKLNQVQRDIDQLVYLGYKK